MLCRLISLLALVVSSTSSTPSTAAGSLRHAQRKPDFVSRVELVATDVVVRDRRGRFVADLRKDDFELLEDGVRQTLTSLSVTRGGRTYNLAAPPPPAALEGIVLPPPRPADNTGGRIFVIFVDDLHLGFRDTGRIRTLMKTIAKDLVQDGDMFAVLSTGPSSISIPMTYDRRRLNEAIAKISGSGLSPNDVIGAAQGSQGPPEVRHRAQVAFATATDMMQNLEQIHDRRKAFIYLSQGYDLDPFTQSRASNDAERYGRLRAGVDGNHGNGADDPAQRQGGNPFAFADLVGDLAQLTRAANRANTSIYTIDPRGLIAAPEVDQRVDASEYLAHVRSAQDTLRVLAESTGGVATVNQNDLTRALKRIDQDTSDYYVVGYYSSNPDPLKTRRTIVVKVNRPGATVWHRPSYSLRPPAR